MYNPDEDDHEVAPLWRRAVQSIYVLTQNRAAQAVRFGSKSALCFFVTILPLTVACLVWPSVALLGMVIVSAVALGFLCLAASGHADRVLNVRIQAWVARWADVDRVDVAIILRRQSLGEPKRWFTDLAKEHAGAVVQTVRLTAVGILFLIPSFGLWHLAEYMSDELFQIIFATLVCTWMWGFGTLAYRFVNKLEEVLGE